MAFFVVTYDLRKKGEFDYKKLWDDLAKRDAVKIQESVYLVSSSMTLEQMKSHVAALMHADDLLMVIKFSEKPAWTKALPGTNAWITSHWP